MPLDESSSAEREIARKLLVKEAGSSRFHQDINLAMVLQAASTILQQRTGRYLLAETDRDKQALFGEVAQDAVALVLECRRALEKAREANPETGEQPGGRWPEARPD